MANRRWLAPVVALGAGLLYLGVRRGTFSQISANLRAFSMPSASIYGVFADALFGGFYDRVARELATKHPTGSALDVGSGPGNLVVRLAQIAPNLMVTGVDISPEMVEQANRRAAEAGVLGRVRFEVGDVGALPFPDEHFDLVVSTSSLHHWSDPARGLSEICRVLKRGGEADIFDLADWILRATHHGTSIDQLVAATPFGRAEVETLRWPGPLPFFRRLHLRRG